MLKNGWYNDLVGRTFGMLIVIEHLGIHNSFRVVKVRCECGVEKAVRWGNLTRKKGNKSCGCTSRQRATEGSFKHGDCNSRLYSIWTGIKTRTKNKNVACVADYGGRGITICPEWLDYLVFKEWALANGYEENLTIDRYPNNDGNYEPSNCRWATQAQQVRNRRNTLKITIGGVEKPLIEWAEVSGLTYRVLFDRVKRKWPERRLLEEARAY